MRKKVSCNYHWQLESTTQSNVEQAMTFSVGMGDKPKKDSVFIDFLDENQFSRLEKKVNKLEEFLELKRLSEQEKRNIKL